MIRILLAILLFGTVAAARAADYTDIWYNPAQSGYGYNVVQSNDGIAAPDGKSRPFLFVTFFIFGSSGEPTWYTAELTWNGTDAFQGPVYKSRGTFFGSPWKPADSSATAAGTATFKPNATNDWQATLIYVVDGVGSATHPLERQTLTRNFTGGNYFGYQLGQYNGGGCNMSSNPYYYTDRYWLTVTDDSNTGGNVTFKFEYLTTDLATGRDVVSLTCTLAGKYEQHGLTLLVRNATYVCSDGTNARANMSEIRATPLGLEGRYTSTLTSSCTESATFSGPYY
jgi:hypothetical protein